MDYTQNYHWAIPEEGSDPWYVAMKTLMNLVDAQVFTLESAMTLQGVYARSNALSTTTPAGPLLLTAADQPVHLIAGNQQVLLKSASGIGGFSCNYAGPSAAPAFEMRGSVINLYSAGVLNFQDSFTTNPIPFSGTGDTALTTTKQNIIGAINECKASAGASSLQAAYNGGQTINISGAALSFTTAAAPFNVVLQGPPFQVQSGTGYFNVQYQGPTSGPYVVAHASIFDVLASSGVILEGGTSALLKATAGPLNLEAFAGSMYATAGGFMRLRSTTGGLSLESTGATPSDIVNMSSGASMNIYSAGRLQLKATNDIAWLFGNETEIESNPGGTIRIGTRDLPYAASLVHIGSARPALETRIHGGAIRMLADVSGIVLETQNDGSIYIGNTNAFGVVIGKLTGSTTLSGGGQLVLNSSGMVGSGFSAVRLASLGAFTLKDQYLTNPVPLSATGVSALTTTAQSIIGAINECKAAATGEANTTSNLGSGTGLAATKSGVNLPFKSLVAGTGIGLAATATEVTISGTGEANTASNIGTGIGLAATKSGVNLPFKTLKAGTNVTLSSDADSVTINASGGGGGSGITFDELYGLGNIDTGGGLTAGQNYATSFIPKANITVSQIACWVTYAGHSPEKIRMGIYDNAGNLIASTAAGDPTVEGIFWLALTSSVALMGGVRYWLAVKGAVFGDNLGQQTCLNDSDLAIAKWEGDTALSSSLSGFFSSSVAPWMGVKA